MPRTRRRTLDRSRTKTKDKPPSTDDETSSVPEKDDDDEYVHNQSSSSEDEQDEIDSNDDESLQPSTGPPPRRSTRSASRSSGRTTATARGKRKPGSNHRPSDEYSENDDDNNEKKMGTGVGASDETNRVRRSPRRSARTRTSQGSVLVTLPLPSSRGTGAATKDPSNDNDNANTKREGEGSDDESNGNGNGNGKDDDDNDGDDDYQREASDSSDEEEEEEDPNNDYRPPTNRRGRSRPIRKRTNAQSRTASALASASKRKPARRRKAVHSSDEEFVVDSDDESSSPDNNNDDDEEKEEYVDAASSVTDNDNDIARIGDADLSSSEEEENDNGLGKKPPADNRWSFGGEHPSSKPKSTRATTTASDDDDDDDDDEIAPTPHSKPRRSAARCPVCPSTEDAITYEPLPKRHVCYIAPDGLSRQCFNLETLRQIALNSSQLQLRVDVDGERQNFLQPPAFRTAMSDDLVDQIASRFGRGALDLHGAYYKNRDRGVSAGGDLIGSGYDNDNDNDSSDENENIYDSFDAFRDRLRDYFKRGMGSQDVYVCPLCYGQLHRTLVKPPDDGDDESGDNDDDNDETDEVVRTPSELIYDPITVLGHADNDELLVASLFCFKKLTDVKRHLREVHHVDTRGVDGNELYHRFRIRAPDGLLQRWLSTQVFRGQVKQGHMRMYWGQGNDQSFVQLLDSMERARVHNEEESWEEEDVNDECDGDDLAARAREFYGTFAHQTFKQWQLLSSPYLKNSDAIKDFIARDDVDVDVDADVEERKGQEQEDEKPHAFLHQQLMQSMKEDSDENDFVHKLRRKYAEPDEYEYESDSTDEEIEVTENGAKKNAVDGSDDDDDVQARYNRNGYYSPIEEDEDEWMAERQRQRKRKASPFSNPNHSNGNGNGNGTNAKIKTPTGKRLVRRKLSSTVVASASAEAGSCSPGKRRSLTIQESSSDGESVF